MKLVNVSQWVPSAEYARGSPTRLMPAGRPVVNPACVWGNPGCGTRGIKDAGRVLSPEMYLVVVRRITITPRRRGKADTLHLVEGSSLRQSAAVLRGHHRGLRPGHASTGETWELGRSNTLLKRGRSTGSRVRNVSRLGREEAIRPYRERTKGMAERYRKARLTNRSPRDGVLEVLVEHSTDGRAKVRTLPAREGGEVRPKRPAVGKVKPGSASDGEKHARDSSS
jgi:hypothetical protein